jgi:signal transduction histidine kinase/DNA-binding response OmpR family regulator
LLTNTLIYPFVLILLILGAIGFLATYSSKTLEGNRRLVVHTHQVIDSTRAILSDLQDAETGQRGFLLTGRQDYLEPYDAARLDLPKRLAAVADLVTDNPDQTRRVARLKELSQQRIEVIESSLAAYRSQGLDAARSIVLSDTGKRLMDDIRVVVADIIATENTLLTDRVERASVDEGRVLLIAVGAGAIAFVIVIVAMFLLRRVYRQQQEAQAEAAHRAGIVQATLDNARDGIAVFDSGGRLIAFNPSFFTYADLPADCGKVGALLADLQAADAKREQPLLGDLLRLETAPGEARSASRRVTAGKRELECYRTAMPNGGFLISCEDVTSRVHAETIVSQAQKMEAIGQLTGGVAHDFNNLLQIVGSNLDMLAKDVLGNERAARRLQLAMAGVERGARLTRQLLAFARRQPLDPKVVNLGRLVGDMGNMLRRTLGEHIEVETLVAGGLWNAQIDPGQFENAILNLAINARDAMNDGGHLTVEVANAFLDDAYVAQNTDVKPGQYVMLAVTDTGSGMSPDVAARVFEPFFSTKPEGQGTGLGLSQVYGFVKQSGGHIKLYSEVGHGTTVKVYLPRSRLPEESAATQNLSSVEGGNETILVVEDDPGVRQAVVDMVSGLGYRVLQAHNGDSALAVLGSGVAIDLLFTDVVMPGKIKARDLAQWARDRLPDLVVLFTSGYTENAINGNGHLDDDVQLLSKPYGRDELARKLRAVLAARKPAEPPKVEAALTAKPDRLKLLVVEDDAVLRMTTLGMIEDLNHEAVGAGDADEALAILAREDGFDVLLSDVGLPGMSGVELAAEVRRQWPDMRIVVASGYDSSHLKRGDLLPDGSTVLGKPFKMDDLQMLLDEFLRERALIRSTKKR